MYLFIILFTKHVSTKKNLNEEAKLNLNFFPNIPVTSKPVEIHIKKGKKN